MKVEKVFQPLRNTRSLTKPEREALELYLEREGTGSIKEAAQDEEWLDLTAVRLSMASTRYLLLLGSTGDGAVFAAAENEGRVGSGGRPELARAWQGAQRHGRAGLRPMERLAALPETAVRLAEPGRAALRAAARRMQCCTAAPTRGPHGRLDAPSVYRGRAAPSRFAGWGWRAFCALGGLEVTGGIPAELDPLVVELMKVDLIGKDAWAPELVKRWYDAMGRERQAAVGPLEKARKPRI